MIKSGLAFRTLVSSRAISHMDLARKTTPAHEDGLEAGPATTIPCCYQTRAAHGQTTINARLGMDAGLGGADRAVYQNSNARDGGEEYYHQSRGAQ